MLILICYFESVHVFVKEISIEEDRNNYDMKII